MDQLQKSPCKTVRLGCFSSPHRLLVLSVMLFASCALGWLMVLYFSLPLACEREITHTTKTSSSIINNKLTHAKTARSNVAPKQNNGEDRWQRVESVRLSLYTRRFSVGWFFLNYSASRQVEDKLTWPRERDLTCGRS